MKTFCITLPEFLESRRAAERHFLEIGLGVIWFNGIYGEGFGLTTTHQGIRDRKPGDEKHSGCVNIGTFLSHYALWMALDLLGEDEPYMVIEVDAVFRPDSEARLQQALCDVPKDFDILYLGSSNPIGAAKTRVKNEVYVTSHVMCTLAYIISKGALRVLLATNRSCYAPIDVSIMRHSLPHLKGYVVLPRIIDRRHAVMAE